MEVADDIYSLRWFTSVMCYSRVMGVAGYGRAPMSDFKCLKRFWCGCTPFLPLYLQPLGCHLPSTAWNCILVCWLLVTTWADICPIVCSCSQFIPIDVFSSSDHRVIYFRMMRPFSFGYGVYIIGLFTPAHMDPSFKVVSFLDLSLLFFIVIIAWSLYYPI